MPGLLASAFGAERNDAQRLARQAAAAEKAGQIVQAYALYTQAARLDPAHHDYLMHVHSLRPFAELAAPHPKPVAEVEGGHITEEDLAEARKPEPPVRLRVAPGRRDFDLRGDAKSLFEQMAKALDLIVIFDSDYQPGRSIRFRLEDADYKTALHALEAATDSFIVPASDRLIFVANDTTEKRTRYEHTITVLVPIPETVTPQEMQELVAAVRGVMEIQRIVIDNVQHMVLLRDRLSKVRPAEAIFGQLMQARGQVQIEVQLLTSNDSRSLQWGFPLPTKYPLVDFGHIGGFVHEPSIPAGFVNFMTFGGGATLLGIGITNSSVFAAATKSITSSSYDATLTASNDLPATVHIGTKYPIATNSYSASTTGTQAFTVPPPTIQFEDLGLSLKITPHVHGTEEMTLDVEAVVEQLGGGNLNGVPELDNTKFQSSVRLRDGQWAVITGMLSTTQTKTLNGIAGLAGVPVIGPALSSNSSRRDRSDTLIVIKPRLRALPPTEAPVRAFWTGTESRAQTDL